MRLKNKVALVTGGSRGIGRGIAIELAREGAIVIINYSSDDIGAEKTIEVIKNNGGTAITIKGNVKDISFVKSMIDEIMDKYKKLDILVNNAGISKFGMVIDATEEDYYQVMDVNFKSVFNCTKTALNVMMYEKKGVILNISSMWGERGASCEALYSASKGAINSFTKAIAKEVSSCNIRVNAIAPGVIDTEMNEVFSEEEKEELKNEIALERFGTIKEIGRTAAFLCSDDASYITGQIINVDGGKL